MHSNSKRLCSLALVAAITAGASITPADAWWPFGKKGQGGGFLSRLVRKPRPVAAQQIGLVPGNPPAMYWKANGEPKAALLCLHELSLYSGVFDDLGQRMSKQGVAVYAIDERGHGGWQDINTPEAKMNLESSLGDVKASVEIIHKLHPDIPVFVLGEAMGGALALKAAATFPDLIAGVISAAPGGEHYQTTANYIKTAGRMLVGPNKNSGMGPEFIEMGTPKAQLREAYQNDARVRLDVTPRELMDCQFFMYKTKQFAHNITKTPVLIVHGKDDKMSRMEGSTRIYEKLATTDKQMLTVDDGDHYTFEDTKVSDKAFDSTLAWIDQHLKKQQPQ
jgi:acylglycerol lipase